MKVYFSILLLLLFAGCSTSPRVIVPNMDKINPASLSWTDRIVDGEQCHVLNHSEWNHIQVELINRRISGNICIDILNNMNKDK